MHTPTAGQEHFPENDKIGVENRVFHFSPAAPQYRQSAPSCAIWRPKCKFKAEIGAGKAPAAREIRPPPADQHPILSFSRKCSWAPLGVCNHPFYQFIPNFPFPYICRGCCGVQPPLLPKFQILACFVRFAQKLKIRKWKCRVGARSLFVNEFKPR